MNIASVLRVHQNFVCLCVLRDQKVSKLPVRN